MWRVFLACSIALGCGGGWRIDPPEDSVTLAKRVTVSYHGTPRQDAEILVAVDELRKFAAEKCNLKDIYCFHFELHPTTFSCGGIDAVGCYPMAGQCFMHYTYRPKLWQSSIVHEGMHYIYQLCTGDSGANAQQVHEPEFLDDVETVRERVRLRTDPAEVEP